MSSVSGSGQRGNRGTEMLYIDSGLIGRGTFGSVVSASNRDHHRYALKIICNTSPSDESPYSTQEQKLKKKKGKGTPLRLLLEPIIMMSIRHPHLMPAEHIIANSSSMIIVMPCARGTLLCRDVMEFSRLQRWSVELISAIAVLHQHHIIHGDVKPANILLLTDDHIALTDVGLSIIKEHPREDFSHRIGTHTYRAPESLLKERWTEQIDSWALGCTLYEMAYGQVLFPSQRDWDASVDIDATTVKNNNNHRGINAIVDWCNLHSYYTSDSPLRISKNHYPYHSIKLHSKWDDPSMTVFNDLLIKLLHPEPNRRLSVTDVLKHHWVTDVTTVTPLPAHTTLHLAPVNDLPDITRLTNLLLGYFTIPAHISGSTTFFQRTAELYRRVSLNSYDQLLLMLGCGWIIAKIYYHRILPAKVGEHLPELIAAELAILNNLGYCLDLD